VDTKEAIAHLQVSRCPLDTGAPFYQLSMLSVFMQGKNNAIKSSERLELGGSSVCYPGSRSGRTCSS